MRVDVIISPDRQSIHIDLAECRRIPLSSDLDKWLRRYSPASSLLERWLMHHYAPTIISPMALAVVYRPIVVAVYKTPDCRLIAETRPDLIRLDPSMRRHAYWLIDREIAAEWYRLAGIVRPTTGDDRQGAGRANEGKGETAKPHTLDDLTPTAWKLLKTLRKLGAKSTESL